MTLKKYRLKEKHHESFHNSIAFALILGQCFGLMPVQGITGPNERSLYFTWKSWKILYAAGLLIGILFAVYMCLHEIMWHEYDISDITSVVFFGSSFTAHLLFLKLATGWAKLMRSWYIVEVSMRGYGWPPRLNTKLKVMTIVVLTIAAVEHILIVSHNLIRSDRCKAENQDIFEYYFVIEAYPQVFSVMKYYIWAGFFMQMINVISTFSWTYIDLFIMLVSTALALRFKQITQRVETYVETKVSDEFMWRNVREDYSRLSKLCKKLNEEIAYIVLLSFGSNLFFILVQFFHSLKNREEILEKIYFFFSFAFLIGRTICVSIYGAWIHDESQKPLPFLNTVSSAVYKTEIAGTIVTYELVLIQFYGNLLQNPKKTNTTSCY